MNSIDDFPRLRDWWKDETDFHSNLTIRFGHPAYQRIIGLGPAVVPVLLQDLERESEHWFHALSALTGEDAAAGEQTVEGARQAWLSWGRSKHLLPA